MKNQCHDRDLLAYEPDIFTSGSFQAQQRCAGVDGRISGTTFTSLSADFVSSAEPGMVLSVYTSAPQEAVCYEIVAVTSATVLAVSVLRADEDSLPIRPPAGMNLHYYVISFRPQIAQAAGTLVERLRQLSELSGIDPADYADSATYRRVLATSALATIFTARASNAADHDANWVKAEHYRTEMATALAALRLTRAANSDGSADSSRGPGNVTLRRV